MASTVATASTAMASAMAMVTDMAMARINNLYNHVIYDKGIQVSELEKFRRISIVY